MALPIILDTDIGNDPDDLLALAMVLDRVDLFDLRAVITTGKNPNLRAKFVQHLCKLSSRSIPIGVGVDSELSKEPSKIHSDFFRKSGADISSSITFSKAQDLLRDVLSPDITMITIGPLSSLADFIIFNPLPVVDKLSRVVSMGGFISRKSKNKYVKEYNFGSDQNATRLVLAQDFQHICVTKNICSKILMLPDDCFSKKFIRSPARQFAFAFMRDWFNGRKEKKLHDPFTIAAAIKPDNLMKERVDFDIDNNGGCKGSIVDYGQRYATVGGTPRNIDWFFDIFFGEPI